ncbi:DEAD/DEAH box helicase [Kribbella italica]|uniref:RNA helicase n=1 Tax=Kribbella italica TaxID=1540520 RepID=A0A7W9J825_9ACTN|nr:superfamily II DNA/RNA helicase [Kribbella italica]
MTLPVALMGTDLIGQARTGTGKTLGFGIPLLQRTISPGEPDYEELAAPGKPQALVVTPTRELTIQVAKDLTTASTVRTVRVMTIYGGVAYEPQLDTLKSGVDVVVGTPGRLLDLANRGVLDLSHIKVLVLDEADEMLDLGFLPDVERILRKTPELRQTMLFSATMPSAVIGLARTHMRHPLNIRAESHEDTQMVPTTAQFVYRAHDLDKPEVVARILQAEDRGRVMIFCRTKREAGRLTDELTDRGFKAAAIHGDLNQQARERALARFRGDKVDVLICTDVAARGIDVEGVTHVINNTCPEDEKAYIHRIGRTGRAGASGIAVTFVDWADLVRWKTINKALDLPYDEPQEIYSTSPELYHDLGIPTDAKGRIKAAREDKPERDRPPRRSEGESGSAPASGERPGRKRNRNRRRTRSGQAVESVEQKTDADVTAKTLVPPNAATSTEAAEHATVERGERKPRQRNRRRRGGDSGESTESLAPQPAAVEAEAVPAEATEEKPRRTRTRRRTESVEAAAPQETVEAPATVAEVVDVPAEEKPARRTRTRKAAAPAEATVAEAVDAPAEEKPKRTRTRKAAAAPVEAEAPVEEKPKRTRKKAVAAPAAEEAPVVEEAPVAKKVAAKRPAKKAAAKKTVAKKAVTKKAAAEPAADEAAGEKPVKRARKKAAPAVPTFTAPE